MPLHQRSYNIGNDNAAGGDPDSCTFDGTDAARIEQVKESNFMVRFNIAAPAENFNNRNYSLWYNTTDNPSTATQVTTSSSIVQINAGTITDGANCVTELCAPQPESFQSVGEAIDTSNETSPISLGKDENMECQFCVQFDLTASDDANYYFYIRQDDSELDSNTPAQVRTKPGISTSSSSSSRSSSSTSSKSSSSSYSLGDFKKILQQLTYNIGNDDATGGDPDTCTFDGADTPRINQNLEENFMVRLGVMNVTVPTNNRNYSLWYNTVNNVLTSSKVTTTSPIVAISPGSITDGAICAVELCTAMEQDFVAEGEALDTSIETSPLKLGKEENMECQFCVQFDSTASDDTNYYFFIKQDDSELVFNLAAQVRTKPGSSSSSSRSSSSSSSSSFSASSKSSSSSSSSSAITKIWRSYMIILKDYEPLYDSVLIQALANLFSSAINVLFPDEWVLWDADGQIETWYWFEDDELPKYQYMPALELSEDVLPDSEPEVHLRIIRSIYDFEYGRYTILYFMTDSEMIWGSNATEISQNVADFTDSDLEKGE